ncbi:hypothetical protein ElyMa_004720700 [Elysia marginata]|uniref:Uncharacterized protein n=1 Tax=Elysia marginata TaxID=1093978 RepID=A0AAV4IDA3_9GAST|nr:hypothetical protein ElyMa_004720700 [Elysia marginata]
MRGRITVLKHNAPSQESRSFATNCISEAVKSAAEWGSIDTLTYGKMSKRITPFASQNTVAITIAVDICTLNFLVTGEGGCFQVMESRFVSGVFRWTQVSSPVIRLSNRLFFARKFPPGPTPICVVSSSPLSCLLLTSQQKAL